MQLDFEFSAAAKKWSSLHGEQHFRNNLSLLLRWSPFATEAELLKQVSFRCLQGCCLLSVGFRLLLVAIIGSIAEYLIVPEKIPRYNGMDFF